MAALLIGGQETGLLDSSFNLLDRNDRTSESEVGNGEQIVVNVASGNLILSKQDTYLPSNGNDYQLTRTYNSRGELSDSGQPDWMSSTSISLEEKREGGETYYEVKYGDGSVFEYRLDAQSGLYVSTDGGGAFETLEDLNAGRRDRYHFEVIRADQSKISFDRRGNMTRWEDPNGVAIEYTYIGEDLRQVQDGTGQRFFYNYTGGRLTSVTDEAGANLVRYGYNSQGRLSQVTDRDGDVTRYAYTSDGNLSRIELPKTRFEAARVITFEYRRVNVVFPDGGPSGSEVLSKMTDAMGNVTTFDYTFAMGVGNVYQGGSTTVTDAQGNRLTYAYDVNGQITAVTDRSGLDTLYGYDADGNLTSVTDRNGEISRFTYDDRGNLLTSTDNSGNSTTYTYTDFNKLESVTTPEGGETLLTYDARQNLIRQVDPGGDITEFEYDALGNQVRQIVYLDSTDLVDVSKQQITQFLYDAFGNIRRTMDATGVVTENSYDQFGNLTSFTDGNGGVTRYTYDGDNRLLTETDPLGNATTNFYDSVGNRISFRDTNGRVTTYIYDRNNRLITTVDGAGPEARTSTRVYDVVGNATSVTDAKGRTTVYNYNARREVIEVVTTEFESAGEPTRYRTLYSYDGEGRVLTVLDNNRNQTTYTYTETGLLETETNARNLQTSYSYDKNLNVTLISIASAIAGPAGRKQEIKYRYDEEDQLLEIEDAEGNKTSYDYDAPGNVVEVIDGNDNAIRYEYDLLNRLVKETLPERDPQSGEFYTVLRSYDANSNEISKTNENGQTTTFAFDADNRRTKITDENGITTEFEYDRKDNLTRVVIGGRENNEAQITTFVYDQFNQLIKEVDAVGHALISSNAELYRNMRGELGAPGNKDNLTVNQQLQLLDLFTTTYTYDQKGMRTSFTDNLGRKTRFEYDGLDRLVLRTDAQGGTQSFRYDGNDNLIWTQDENDNITQFAFDEADQLTRTANAEGGVISYTYDVFGNVIEQTESGNTAVGRSSTYEYDKNNLLKVEINRNAAGPDRTTTYEYDAVGNRTRVIDARNNATQYQYDALNRNIKIIDPLLQEAVFEYDGVGNQVKIIDPRNGETSFAFDPGNRLLSFTDAEGRKTEYVYDVRGNQIQVTTGIDGLFNAEEQDPSEDRSMRQTTTFEYDAENNLRSVVDASGALTRFDFDRVYNEVAVTDARGNTTLSEFDALNREIKVTDPLGNVTRYAYDALGNNVSITDARGFTTGFEYDGNSNLIIERDALGTETHYENDGFGTSVSITRAAVSLELDPITEEPLTAPRKTQFFYDSFGNLERELDALNGEKTYQYDALNNVTEITDEEGRTTVYTYDESSQLTKITDASEQAGETIFGYDANGNRNVVRDAEGRVTTNYYNANDEVVLSIDALGFATAYEYDTNGNVVTGTRFFAGVTLPVDPDIAPVPITTPDKDQVTRFEYDARNRLVKTIDPLLGEIRNTYDGNGNLIAVTDENGNTTNYAFDELNRLAEILDPRQAGQTEAQRGRQVFTYDPLGNLASTTDQNGNTTRYVYDALDRETEVVDPLGGRTTSTYDAVGNQVTQTDERGNTLSFEYDVLDRLVKRTDSELDELDMPGVATWEYDKVGNRTSLTNEEGEKSLFEYDALNRLVRETDAELNYVKYSLDRVGNEFERRNGNIVAGVDNDDPFSTKFEFDELGRLKKRVDTLDQTRELTYDAFGNLVAEKDENGLETELFYDQNNRLIRTRDPEGNEVNYVYDAAGNRTIEINERGFETVFSYDALNRLTGQTDPLGNTRTVEFDPVGNVVIERDENENSAVSVFDANNRLIRFLSAESYLSTFEYDAAGNQVARSEYLRRYPAVEGPNIPHPDDTPRVTTSTYNTRNQLETSTDAAGLTTFYEYDKAGRLERTFQAILPVASVVSLAGSASSVMLTPGAGQGSVEYDNNGRVIRQVDANDVVTEFSLDNKGNVLQKIEAKGLADERITTYTYDNLSRLKTETSGVGTTIGATITYEYDAADRLITRSTSGDANIGTRIERFEYDDAGRLTAEVNGVDNRTEYFYDAAGNQIRAEYDVSAPGTAGRFNKLFLYDGDNRLIQETDGEGVKTRYEYDANGNKTKTIQAFLHPTEPERVTTYVYDAENNLTSITNPENQTTAYEYDVDGNRTQITDANDSVTRNTFDQLGRIVTNIVDAEGPRGGVLTTNTYDSRGNLLSSSVGFADASDTPRVTAYEYDRLDQLIKVTDPEGFATRFTYDNFGNQTSVVLGLYEGDDPAKQALEQAQATYFFYDLLGRLERTVDSEGNAVRFVYDAHGNQISQTTGILTTAADVAANPDLTQSDDPELTSTTTFSYDLNGELLEKATEEGGRVVITRDRLGRQTRVETLQSSGPDVWVVETFDYDSMGRVVRSTDSFDVLTTYRYDALGNTLEITSAAGIETSATQTEDRTTISEYYLDSNLRTFTDAEGNTTEYFYDDVGNLTRLIDPRGSVTHNFYNGLNQLVGTVDGEGAYVIFEHDAQGNVVNQVAYANLVTVVGNAPPAAAPDAVNDRFLRQDFDGNNNRVSETLADGSVKTYEFNSAGLLVRQIEDVSGLADVAALERTSDTSVRELVWEYDATGRLVKFTSDTGVIEEYKHDSAGNIIEEKLTPATGTNPLANGVIDPVRVTTFTYDTSNRQLSQTLGGGTQSLEYDKAGNVVATVDALGNRVETRYDRNNRIASVTEILDPADLSRNQVITYRYNAVGSLIESTDARGAVYSTTVDLNNRLISESGPPVTVYNIDSNDYGATPTDAANLRTGVRPTVTQEFDAAGNVIRITDESGFVTARWYDDNNRLVAEIDGNGILETYRYNAFGEVIEFSVDREFAGRVDPTSEPTPTIPAADAITTSYAYDLLGRLTLTTYSEIAVTTLNANGSAIATVQDVAPTQANFYDAFGNLVESVDKNGNSEYNFYDRADFVIAQVDVDGFLVRSDFDVLGNLVRQRKYEDAVSVSTPGVVPAGIGDFTVLERIYNLEGLLVTEISPQIQTDADGGTTRVTTSFVYDAVGNLKQKTLASGTGQQQIEYYYYDAVGRRTGVVDSSGILAFFVYDKNGNTTEQRRFITPVSASAATLAAPGTTAESLLANLATDALRDQTTIFAYNQANLVTTQTDVMGALGGGDDIVTAFDSDESGNMTRRTDPDGYVSYIDYDAAGSVVVSIAPNGSRSFRQFNTLGLLTKSWIGGVEADVARPVTDIDVQLSNEAGSDLEVTWTPPPNSTATSWVAWDTQPRFAQEAQYVDGNVPSTAPNAESAPNSDGRYRFASGAGSNGASVPLNSLPAGQTVYFRVMTDIDGNLSWSDEQSIVIPPRISGLTVQEGVGGNFTIAVEFDASLGSSPELRSAGGTVVATLNNVSGNLYEASIAGGGTPQSSLLSIAWSSLGNEYETNASALLAASGPHENQGNGFFSGLLPNRGAAPLNGPNAGELLILNGVSEFDAGVSFPDDGVVFPDDVDAQRINQTLQFNPPAVGTVNYDIYYGETVTASRTVDISFTDQQTLRASNPRRVMDGDGNLTSSVWTMTWVNEDTSTVQTKVDVNLSVGGPLQIAYRTKDSDGEFDNVVAMTDDGSGDWSRTLNLEAGIAHDLKVFYIDADGDEVIVEWRRFATPEAIGSQPAGTTTVSGSSLAPPSNVGTTRNQPIGAIISYSGTESFKILAAERGGEVFGPEAARSINPGTYSGPRDVTALIFDLGDPGEAGAVGFLAANYEDIYFTEIDYNDIGQQIASNEDTGLWRIFGVDANGNKLVTGLYGTRAAADADSSDFGMSRNSFASFDARGNETRTVGVVANGQAAVTTTTYDYDGRVLTLREPGASITRQFDYDGVGNLIRETDSLGNPTQYVYDLLGNRVSARRLHSGSAASGVYHTEMYIYSYTGIASNEMTSTFFVGKENETISYTYDGFGRQTAKTNGRSETIRVDYDQQSRITQLTDAMGFETKYFYDKRGNQTWVQDPENNYFGAAYDGMGLVTHSYAFTSTPGSLAQARALASAGVAPTLVVSRTNYDIWTNKRETIDPEGRSQSFRYAGFGRITSVDDTSFEYDQWGNQTREHSFWGKDIRRSYDEAGRLTRIDNVSTDRFGTFFSETTRLFTEFDYDVAGNRVAERLWANSKDTSTAGGGILERNKTYGYDAKGQLTAWRENISGVGADYVYFADGNISSITQVGQAATTYAFDGAGRVSRAGAEEFSYDNAGNRASSSVGGTYTYDANGWVRSATQGDVVSTWTYDRVGNVTEVEVIGNAEAEDNKSTVNTYDDRYLNTQTVSGTQTTSTFFDRSGRTLSTRIDDVDADGEPTALNYAYTYYFFGPNVGRQQFVTGSGSDVVTSSSSSIYDVNGNLVRVDLGQGDAQERPEINRFAYDNDGKIITAIRDSGVEGETPITTEYLYVNGNPAGEYEEGKVGEARVNEGPYSTVRPVDTGLGDDSTAFPGSTIIQHTVEAGDTLRALADRYYGSPDLWYVIADANGLTGKEDLKLGSRLVVPNTSANAYQNAETNTLYREGDIIGSQLPNLASPPPPPKDFCALIAALILVIVVAIAAVVLTIVTIGIAAPAAASAVLGSTVTLGAVITSAFAGSGVALAALGVAVAVGAVIGGAIAFAASALTQGILLAFGLQETFDWEAVAGDVVAGIFGGAAAGLGAIVSAATKATALVKVISVVAQSALDVAGEAAAQAISNDGKIDNPWVIAAAGAGGAFGAVADFGSRAAKAAKAVDTVTGNARKGFGSLFESVDDVAARARGPVTSTTRKAFDTKVFAAVFKSEFTKITQPVSGTIAAGKKLVSAGAGLVTAPVKALRAGGEALAAGARALKSGGLPALGKVVKEGAKSLGASISKSAGDALAAIKKAPQQIREFRSTQRIIANLDDVGRTGTVSKDQFSKTVRFFDTIDGVKVTRYKTVVRTSAKTAGKTDTTKLIRGIGSATDLDLQAGTKKVSFTLTEVERLSVAQPSKLKRFVSASKTTVGKAAESIGNRIKKPFVAIKEFALTRGSASKLETTKLKRSFDEVDGKRVEKFTESVRNSRKTGFKTDNFKTQRVLLDPSDPAAIPGRLGQTKIQVVARKNPAGTSVLSKYVSKPLKNAGDAAKTALTKVAKDGRLETFIGKKGGALASVLPPLLGEERSAGVKGSKSGLYKSILGSGQLTNADIKGLAIQIISNDEYGLIDRGPLIVAPQWLTATLTVVGVNIPSFVLGQDSKDPASPPTQTLNDRNARVTYADLHARQHTWLQVDWVKVAANSTTQVFSPFAIDRSATLEAVLASNRMVAGQVGNFETDDVVAFSERSVGGVKGDLTKMPGMI